MRATAWRNALPGSIAVLLIAGAAWAQPGGTARPGPGEPRILAPRDPSRPPEDEKDQVRLRQADRARYDSRRGLWGLSGNIVFEDEGVELYADEANYNENDETAACAGHLRIVDKENVITGDTLQADFDAEIAIIEGHVKIVTTKTVVQPRPENGEPPAEGKEPEQRITTVTCDKIVYTYTEGQRRAVATGNLKAVQEDKTITASKADYDREKDIVVLSEPVKITMDNGSAFECKRATISVTDNWVDMEGFTGIAIRNKKTPAATPAAGGEAPAPGGPTPPPAQPPPPAG